MKSTQENDLNQIRCPDAPSSWDWRKKGAIEGLEKIVCNSLTELSVQDKDNGECQGGCFIQALDYVYRDGGIMSASDYPYSGTNSPCKLLGERWHKEKRKMRQQKKLTTIDGYESWFLTPISEEALKCLVYQQPVCVAMHASTNFLSHRKGVYRGEGCWWFRIPNHAVLIIGYGTTEEGEDYWLVKNSWGTNWGEGGYGMIKRNTGKEGGICKINFWGAFPTKKR